MNLLSCSLDFNTVFLREYRCVCVSVLLNILSVTRRWKGRMGNQHLGCTYKFRWWYVKLILSPIYNYSFNFTGCFRQVWQKKIIFIWTRFIQFPFLAPQLYQTHHYHHYQKIVHFQRDCRLLQILHHLMSCRSQCRTHFHWHIYRMIFFTVSWASDQPSCIPEIKGRYLETFSQPQFSHFLLENNSDWCRFTHFIYSYIPCLQYHTLQNSWIQAQKSMKGKQEHKERIYFTYFENWI